MLDDQATGDSTMGGQFAEGTPVYDVNGDEIGHVSEHGVQDNCLVVHHGLLRDDVYVPLNVIQRNDADGVYLSLGKNEALDGQEPQTVTGQVMREEVQVERVPVQG